MRHRVYDGQTKLVLGGAPARRLQQPHDRGLVPLTRQQVLLEREVLVQAAVLDVAQESGGDVGVLVDELLALLQLGQAGDGADQLLRVRRHVRVGGRVTERRLRVNLRDRLLVRRQLCLHLLGHLRKLRVGVGPPERVVVLQVVRLLPGGGVEGAAALGDVHAVQSHVEDVVDERGVGPGVLQRRGEVEVALEDAQDRSLLSTSQGERSRPGVSVVGEHGPARVDVIAKLLRQLLRDHLRGAPARAPDDGHAAQRGAHREQPLDNLGHRGLDVGILRGGIVERDVRVLLRQGEDVLGEGHEVNVLVEHLRHLARGVRLDAAGREVLEHRPREG